MAERLFDLVEVADGVHFAEARDPVLALGNAGFVDLGDRAVVFDTFASPEAGRALLAAAEARLGRAPDLVVNSHAHGDHVLGNAAFAPRATFLSTGETRRGVARLADRAAAETERLRPLAPHDPEAASRLARLEALRIVPPDVTFEDAVELHGSRRSALVRTPGGGHTASDAVLLVPDAGVLFAGDLLFGPEGHPWAGDGDPAAWAAHLRALAGGAPRVVLPGHGAPTTAGTLLDFAAYLDALAAAVDDLAADPDRPVDDVRLPDPHDGRDGREWLTRSLHVLRGRRAAARSG